VSAPQVLCASNATHDSVEPLTPPAAAPVGERVWFGGGDSDAEQTEGGSGTSQPAPLEANRIQKKKVYVGMEDACAPCELHFARFVCKYVCACVCVLVCKHVCVRMHM
jgi:hypothetical protein